MRVRNSCIFIAVFFMITTVIAEPMNKNIFTEDKSGITVTRDHPQFSIKLKSNPTTGYTWFLRECDLTRITPETHTFETNPDKNLMGAPGSELWTFRVNPSGFVVPQQTILRFVYARPWEGTAQSKQIVFRVSTLDTNSSPSEDPSQK